LHEPHPRRRVMKCFLLHARGKMRQIQCHWKGVQISPGEGTAS
jgi:hypothetical protein